MDKNQTQNTVELRVLHALAEANTDTRQRDLARAAQVSLPMINAIIRRLAAKGLLQIERINGRTLRYALTPDGTREITRRSYRYMRRTIGSVVRWKDDIDTCIRAACRDGITAVELVGPSDLDFIVEHCCRRSGADFRISQEHEPGTQDPQTLVIYSEQIEPVLPTGDQPRLQIVYLQHVLTG